MKRSMLTNRRLDATRSAMACKELVALVALPALAGLSGCIQVTAPDKPIEINLNINVKQEVLVKLQQDAAELIQDNPELFPK